MTLNYSDLSIAERDFVDRVTHDLARNWDPMQIGIHGDGTSIPEGYKFAASRQGASWLDKEPS